MTPKLKALELLDKYSSWVRDYDIPKYSIINQKQCALITVNEMLNNFLSNRTTNYGRERYHFWQKVKLEIEKL